MTKKRIYRRSTDYPDLIQVCDDFMIQSKELLFTGWNITQTYDFVALHGVYLWKLRTLDTKVQEINFRILFPKRDPHPVPKMKVILQYNNHNRYLKDKFQLHLHIKNLFFDKMNEYEYKPYPFKEEPAE